MQLLAVIPLRYIISYILNGSIQITSFHFLCLRGSSNTIIAFYYYAYLVNSLSDGERASNNYRSNIT